MNRADSIELIQLLEEQKSRIKYNAINYYSPYDKQKEFHKHGLDYAERCLGAGNQLGKTLAGSMEAAYHATGLYPDWWAGAMFDKPTVGWAAGVTGEAVRDSVQKLLIGRIQKGDEFLGTGSLPRSMILDTVNARGTADLKDHVKVKHKSGGVSIIYFKTYAQGRAKFQAETIDWIWFDEEPPADIYSEGKTRTNNGQLGQFVMMTFTPLLGMTTVVTEFYKNPRQNQKLIIMTIKDVGHYTEQEKLDIIDSYPEHEREARVNGVPILGSGRIFQYKESAVSEPHITDIPDHWALLNGMDFGWDHPQACIQIAWDRDEDVIHVIRGKRASKTKPNDMYLSCKVWAEGIPTAWPHDGLQHDKGSGQQLRLQYAVAGFNMLDDHATHDEGGTGVEAGLMEMQERFGSGRLKIDETLDDFWEEYRLYHRKDGKIIKENDDFICAVRYAIMMKREAAVKIKKAAKAMTFASEW